MKIFECSFGESKSVSNILSIVGHEEIKRTFEDECMEFTILLKTLKRNQLENSQKTR